MSEFLTTKEVADLLRLKERKVYDLVKCNAIPVSRITGKLLFPRDLIEAWVRSHASCADGVEGLQAKPCVFGGSHDPLLEWALRESGSGIASYFDGSLDGLQRMTANAALAAGLHIHSAAGVDGNCAHVKAALPGAPVVVFEWCARRQGLVLPPGGPQVKGLKDLKGKRFISRQESAGSQLLLTHLMAEAGLSARDFEFSNPPARNETDVAQAIADGKGDAGLAIEAVARQFRLPFVFLAEERYDIVAWRRDYFEEPIQKLIRFAQSPALLQRAKELGGYDLSGLGRIHYNG